MRRKRVSASARRQPLPGFAPYRCAFCGEENEVVADPSAGRRQAFTEDCAVCCRPNLIVLTVEDDGEVQLQVTQEYEA